MTDEPFTTITKPEGSLIFLGSDVPGGCYVLKMWVNDPICMAFGQFAGGKSFDVEPGYYSYVGSALKAPEKKGFPLARRLVRHATRCVCRAAFAIRDLMQAEFVRRGLGQGDLRPNGGKHLKWNVDHLLQRPCVELLAAFVIRCHDRIECDLGRLLLDDSATVAFAPGLGAADYDGGTHLLRVDADEQWWLELPGKIFRKFGKFL